MYIYLVRFLPHFQYLTNSILNRTCRFWSGESGRQVLAVSPFSLFRMPICVLCSQYVTQKVPKSNRDCRALQRADRNVIYGAHRPIDDQNSSQKLNVKKSKREKRSTRRALKERRNNGIEPKLKWKWSMLIAFGILIFSYLIQSIRTHIISSLISIFADIRFLFLFGYTKRII